MLHKQINIINLKFMANCILGLFKLNSDEETIYSKRCGDNYSNYFWLNLRFFNN